MKNVQNTVYNFTATVFYIPACLKSGKWHSAVIIRIKRKSTWRKSLFQLQNIA